MTKQHFKAFAEIARTLRARARVHEKDGNAHLAQADYNQAIGIEDAVIKVGLQFNPNFDSARFRQACNPDL